MDIATRIVFWFFLVLDIIYNILVFIYAWYLMRSHDQINMEQLTELMSQVDEFEIIGIKFGRIEIIKVVIAHLIQKGFITIREIIHEEERLEPGSDWNGNYYRNRKTTRTYSYTYLYRAALHREPENLTPLEQSVISVLTSYKSAEQAEAELQDLPVFHNYRQKMRDFFLVREKTPLEEGIELFYTINYLIFGISLLLSFIIPGWTIPSLITIISGINTLFGIITRLIYYAGQMSFNHIYPRMIPLPAYARFLKLYETTYCPVSGARAYRAVLEGRE